MPVLCQLCRSQLKCGNLPLSHYCQTHQMSWHSMDAVRLGVCVCHTHTQTQAHTQQQKNLQLSISYCQLESGSYWDSATCSHLHDFYWLSIIHVFSTHTHTQSFFSLSFRIFSPCVKPLFSLSFPSCICSEQRFDVTGMAQPSCLDQVRWDLVAS